MSEELDKLKSLGAQKIYEDTHIPVLHVQAILHNSFDSFSKVQFLGFISILEREYGLDLKTLKAAGLAHFDDIDTRNEDDSLFVTPKKQKSQAGVYAVIALVIFLFVVIYQSGVFSQDEVKKQSVDDRLIQKVQKTIEPLENQQEANLTNEQNSTDMMLNSVEEEPEVIIEVQKPIESFKIVTKSKVWFGYIDVDTNKKNQKTFTGEMELDPQKRWLLIFGHGYVDMFVDGEKVKRESRDNIRFLYEDGKVKAISTYMFKELNRGSKW